MKTTQRTFIVIIVLVIIGGAIFFASRQGSNTNNVNDNPLLTVAISPYQDLAMLVNADAAGIAKKHNLRVKLVTMAWEDILPAIGSHGKTVDVGFGSFVEYLTKYSKLNEGETDPILFIQPLYVYKGGGFIAMRDDVPVFSSEDLRSTEKLAALRSQGFRYTDE